MHQFRCEYDRCGRLFESRRRHARFCSDACRGSASRQRSKEGILAIEARFMSEEARRRAAITGAAVSVAQQKPPTVDGGARSAPPGCPSAAPAAPAPTSTRPAAHPSSKPVATPLGQAPASTDPALARYEERLSALERTVERSVRPINKRLEAIEASLEQLSDAMALLITRQAELSAMVSHLAGVGHDEA